VPEAATVVFATSCGVPTGSTVDPIKGVATLVFRDSCHGAMFDLIGVASGGRLLTPQFIKVTKVAHVAGTTFTVPGAFAAMSSFTVTLSKIPDVISNLTATRSSMIEGTPVVAQSSAPVDPPAGDLPVVVPYTPAFGTRSEVAVTVNRPETRFAQRYEVRTPSLASSVDIDLGTLPLPWLTDVAITPTGTTWTTIDGVTSADGILTQWGGGWNDGTRPVTVAWRVIQPVDTAGAGMTLPRLPPADAIVDPGQQTVTVTPSIAAVLVADYSNVAGYDELRKLPETLLLSSLSTLGTFVNEPFQRRTFAAISSRGVAGVTGVAPRGR
jgi:hypothetical protein